MTAMSFDGPAAAKNPGPVKRGLPPWSWKSTPMVLVHVLALGVFVVPFSWSLVWLTAGIYTMLVFGVTAGFHRYFSHRTFKTSRVFQFVLAWIGTSSVQKGVLWWAANHRHHHKHSDQGDDLHSPGLHGFVWAHIGWILATDWERTQIERIPDLAKYPELMWLNRWHLVPPLTQATVLYLIGGLPWLVWGFFFTTVLCWHATFVINSLTHMFGRRRYETSDDSRNSFILAIITMGEGWHNNHHYYQSSTRQGFFWWEIDLSYYILRLLAVAGVVWDLREPPAHVVAGQLRNAA
ncbi:MAG: acyl-CoA desaturase [Vicinamibacterales bacterium]